MTSKTQSVKLRGKVKIGVDNAGKDIYKYVSADTPKELEMAKQAAREYYIYGRDLPQDAIFADYAENWYFIRKEPFISEASKSSYKVCFMKHLLPEFGLQHMKAISANQIQKFVNGFAGSSRSQITMIIGTLKAIFSTAYAEGVIERDPTVSIIRPKPARVDEKRPLTEAETKAVLETIATHPEGAFLAVLYYLGVRRGEALGLKWDDFDWHENLVHIQRDIDYTLSTAREDTLKTAAADRFIPVPPELKTVLLPLREGDDEYLFHGNGGKPLSQATFKRMWARLMAACGCVEWRDKKNMTGRTTDILKQVKPTLTPHFFRHNYVTLLYESGVDPLIAMKIVGHSDYQTTANIYTHLKDETLRKASVNMNKVFQTRER